VRDHATHGLNSAKVLLLPGKYPGLISDYFIGEWQGYQTFACDIYLSGNTPLGLTIRINDNGHNQEYPDRYNHTFTLQPGPNHIDVPLLNVEKAPRTRRMDMEHIISYVYASFPIILKSIDAYVLTTSDLLSDAPRSFLGIYQFKIQPLCIHKSDVFIFKGLTRLRHCNDPHAGFLEQ
jgi:hypothetical protein